MKTFRYIALLSMLTALLLSAILGNAAQAANWLMLQGTEPPNAKKAHNLWGFAQPGYVNDRSDDPDGLTAGFAANNGERLAMTQVAPWFDDNERFYPRRLRFGARGRFSGLLENSFTSKMNYFVFAEAASSLMTHDPLGERERFLALDHASLTFNHIPGARIRVGLFQTPGPEETFQAVHTQDYIEFTDFIAREKLERFTDGAAQPAASPDSPSLGVAQNTAYGFNAERGWGIQVFDSFLYGQPLPLKN
ncbi:MAG: hypothetical protein BECKG1743D_GA0114223_105366 [Candidatus Kentron sp. G]|nr:MAG: hypothetical protein BECKG1743F_GA0114225_102855 [Candidatus Kentron sp. G]VFN02220.1 MAG: hypothetical protein BECKG1743E_GA0114224_104846 [Candidatus Kentron sp. G]VFN03999.1 MAG: hypothetical protein BECKG1743D_GA0114223_105366 [Candidatus Kentron sp. G]